MDREQAKRIADKYIGPRGGKPRPVSSRPVRRKSVQGDTVTILREEYRELVAIAVELADKVVCEKCGALLDVAEDEPCVDEVTGCWWFVTGDNRFKDTCRSWKAPK